MASLLTGGGHPSHPSHPSAVEHLSGVLRERQKALLGGLELGELLGRGSFGKVYKGDAQAPHSHGCSATQSRGTPWGNECMLWEECGVGRCMSSCRCTCMVHAMERQEPDWPHDGWARDQYDESACYARILDPACGGACAGRWRGAMVAVKIVTHDRTLATLAETLRESALSTSIQHPNVVCTCSAESNMTRCGPLSGSGAGHAIVLDEHPQWSQCPERRVQASYSVSSQTACMTEP